MFYRKCVAAWVQITSGHPDKSESILNQSLWNNTFIQAGGNSLYFKAFSQQGVNYIKNIINPDGAFKEWTAISNQGIPQYCFLQWYTLTHSIPHTWINILQNTTAPYYELTDSPIVINDKIYQAETIDSKMAYLLLVNNMFHTPTAQQTWDNKFKELDIDWPSIYSNIYKSCLDTYILGSSSTRY